MPTAGFSPPQGNQSTAQLQDWIIKLCRDLEYYMNNLDTVNISRLDARVIIAQSITALQIAANSITANEIAANAITTSELAAGAVTADKITVTELSAITANMGTITAGSITTNAEINVGTDATIGKYLYLNATSSSGVEKGIIFKDAGSQVGSITSLSGDLSINSPGGNILLGGTNSYANGGKIATEGISVIISVMGGDGITPMTLTFDGGTLSSVV